MMKYENFILNDGTKFKVSHYWFCELCINMAKEDKHDFETIEDRATMIAETIEAETVFEEAKLNGEIIFE